MMLFLTPDNLCNALSRSSSNLKWSDAEIGASQLECAPTRPGQFASARNFSRPGAVFPQAFLPLQEFPHANPVALKRLKDISSPDKQTHAVVRDEPSPNVRCLVGPGGRDLNRVGRQESSMDQHGKTAPICHNLGFDAINISSHLRIAQWSRKVTAG
jgi:hypothetical protein